MLLIFIESFFQMKMHFVVDEHVQYTYEIACLFGDCLRSQQHTKFVLRDRSA